MSEWGTIGDRMESVYRADSISGIGSLTGESKLVGSLAIVAGELLVERTSSFSTI